MKKILVGTDGSEAATKAIRLGAQLASAFKAKLALAYVLAPVLPADIYGTVTPELYEREQEAADAVLKAATELIGLPCEQLLLRGPPAESLAEAAENSDFDLVIVGSHGRGAVARILLGSVADRLLHICKKPVLVSR